MNRRICCALAKTVQSYCEMGCVYREKAFRHTGCPKAKKTDGCVAPCPVDVCDCMPKKEFAIVPLTKKEKNEVFLL